MVIRSPEVVDSTTSGDIVVINAGPVVGVDPSVAGTVDGGTPQMQMPQTGVGVGAWVVV